MAIAVLPPVSFTQNERGDIVALTNLILSITTVLTNTGLSMDAVTSLNNTILDSSDRIDAIVNPVPSA